MLALEPKRLGATWLGDDRCRFEVWAPLARAVEVRLHPDRIAPLTPITRGYHAGIVDGVRVGARYTFRLDGDREVPDPASRLQPEGVDGPSEVVDVDWRWADEAWRGVPRRDLVLYEVHVGTFSAGGDFVGVVPAMEVLRSLGVNALVLLPLGTCGGPGWGDAAAAPMAVDPRYGGPLGLMRLVEACHEVGMAVIADVLHAELALGAQGLQALGPYFDESRRTSFGPALDLVGPGSDEVRRFVIEGGVRWLRDYHLDGIRVRSAHASLDASARPFLAELAAAVRDEADRTGRRAHLLVSSDENDARLVRSPDAGGMGYDLVHSPDLAWALRAALVDDREGPLQDYGRVADVARAWATGFAWQGERSSFRGRRWGSSTLGVPPGRFVASTNDHVHLARAGDRLVEAVGLGAARLAAGLVLLGPATPLLFMGEEYGDPAPFVPFDSPEGAARCRVDHAHRRSPGRSELRDLHAELLKLRRSLPGLRDEGPITTLWSEADRWLLAVRGAAPREIVVVFHLGGEAADVELPIPAGCWRLLVDTAEERWGGAGARVAAEVISEGTTRLALGPRGFLLFERVR